MSNLRVSAHPIFKTENNRRILSFNFDGTDYEAMQGDTIASALLANGIRVLRRHEESGTPRGIFCNIGHCFECRVTVNGLEGQRACMTAVRDNMQVRSGGQLPTPFKEDGGDTHA